MFDLRLVSLRLVWAVLASVAVGGPAAQACPDRPVTFLVPYAPGGGTDVYARILAEGLQQQLKQSFVIENKAGAATQIAASALINAPADGHTIMMAAGTTLVVN